jgi:hypothetical protein
MTIFKTPFLSSNLKKNFIDNFTIKASNFYEFEINFFRKFLKFFFKLLQIILFKLFANTNNRQYSLNSFFF